jgi:O-antigen/teichoic acid export membrane protein
MVQPKVKTRQLRSFGLIVGGVFAFIGVWPKVYHSASPRLWALVLAAVLILPALISPSSLRPFYQGWMRVGQLLGWINTRVILGIIFYLLFLPVGLIMRLLGKDSMNRKFDSGATTYRVPRHAQPASHMKHQF